MSASQPPDWRGGAKSTLVTRNVIVCGHRTSMRLEPAMWDALAEVCRRQGQTVHEICSSIDQERSESTLTSAMRNFIVNYFRMALMQAPTAPPTAPVERGWMDRARAS